MHVEYSEDGVTPLIVVLRIALYKLFKFMHVE